MRIWGSCITVPRRFCITALMPKWKNISPGEFLCVSHADIKMCSIWVCAADQTINPLFCIKLQWIISATGLEQCCATQNISVWSTLSAPQVVGSLRRMEFMLSSWAYVETWDPISQNIHQYNWCDHGNLKGKCRLMEAGLGTVFKKSLWCSSSSWAHEDETGHV